MATIRQVTGVGYVDLSGSKKGAEGSNPVRCCSAGEVVAVDAL
jgi:hypothetical protein